MTNPNLKSPAENFLALGRAAAESFRVTFGYDYVEFNYFKITEAGDVHFYFDLIDDFQRDLGYGETVDHGHSMKFSYEAVCNLSPATWRVRKQRELAVLARKTAEISGLSDKVEDEMVKAFIATLTDSMKDLAGLIEAPRYTE